MATSKPYTAFHKASFLNIEAQKPRTVGKARVAFLNGIDKHSTDKLEQAWPIRPADDRNEKFNLEVRIGQANVDLTKAFEDFDGQIRKIAFANKKDWFMKRADEIDSEADLKQLHTKSIKKGGERSDGSRYDDTVRFKVEGWKDCVDEVVYNEAKAGEDKGTMPKDVVWKPRYVDASGRGGPKDNETNFYLWVGKDMTSGLEKYANKVPCIDAAGNHIKDASDNLVWEFVGPKHCKVGSKLTVVFNSSVVWLSDGKFGVKLAARQVYVMPAPPKTTGRVEGVEIVSYVDPFQAAKAVQMVAAANDDSAEDAPDSSSDGVAETNLESLREPDVADGPVETLGRKRSAAELSPTKTKVAKTGKNKKLVTVDEDL